MTHLPHPDDRSTYYDSTTSASLISFDLTEDAQMIGQSGRAPQERKILQSSKRPYSHPEIVFGGGFTSYWELSCLLRKWKHVVSQLLVYNQVYPLIIVISFYILFVATSFCREK